MMQIKYINRILLMSTLALIALSMLFSYYNILSGHEAPLSVSTVAVEFMLILPVLVGMRITKTHISSYVSYKRLSAKTWGLVIIYILFSTYIITVAGALSVSMFPGVPTSNELLKNTVPMWQMFLAVVVITPAIEEFVYRAFLFNGYKDEAGLLGTLFLSSVLFGLSHGDIRQLLYGTIAALLYALLSEVTGNIITAIIAHAFFNLVNLIQIYYPPATNADPESQVYMIHAGISLCVFMFITKILQKISVLEKYKMPALYPKDKRSQFIILTPSLALAFALLAGLSVLSLVMS